MSDALSELEIEVESKAGGGQRVAIEFTSADEAKATPRTNVATIDIDFDSLGGDFNDGNLEAYGDALRDTVLAPNRALFEQALDAKPLRVRLNIRADDARLQSLHWELMTDFSGAPLSTLNGLAFSRYLPSPRRVELRPASSKLQALVAIADPTEEDRQEYGLAPIDFEQAQLDRSMGDIGYDSLTGSPDPVTMNRLIGQLKAGEEAPKEGYDILYLVCHGNIVRDEPMLYLALETERERANMTYFRSGVQLAKRMARQLDDMPRLVVLASCSGAGYGMDDALYATGPLLAMEGVPAVMAMKGFVEIEMVEALLSRFCSAFQETQAVDRAMQAAREYVQYDLLADDWWAPVLFMRLTDGRLASGDGGWAGKEEEPAPQPEPEQPLVVEPTPVEEPAVTTPASLDMARFDRVKLYRAMSKELGLKDLRDVTYVMGIDYDDLGGSGKSGKAREFIQWCERRNKIPALLEALVDVNADQDWYAHAGLR